MNSQPATSSADIAPPHDGPTMTGAAVRAADPPITSQMVVSADGVPIGHVDGVGDTHLNVRMTVGDSPTHQMWLPRSMIARVDDAVVTLSVERSELHEAVYCLPPGQQREFATLGLSVRIGRARGVGVGQPSGAADPIRRSPA